MKQNYTLGKSVLGSIGIAAVIFCIVGAVIDTMNGGSFTLTGHAFTKMVGGVFAVGLGFGLPTIVYADKKMSTLVKTLIHMGIGCAVLVATSFIVGWVPVAAGTVPAVGMIVGAIVCAFAVWIVFYTKYKKSHE